MGMVYKPLLSLPYNTTSEKDHLHACYILGPNYMIMFHQLHNDLRTVLVWCSCAIAISIPTKNLKRQEYYIVGLHTGSWGLPSLYYKLVGA